VLDQTLRGALLWGVSVRSLQASSALQLSHISSLFCNLEEGICGQLPERG
jgi:hypothetical protein